MHKVEGSLALVERELITIALQVSLISRVKLEIKISGEAFEPVDYASERESWYSSLMVLVS